MEVSRVCDGGGHVRGGGTAPFAKLTALDRDPGILYAFHDLRPAILRWIFRRDRSLSLAFNPRRDPTSFSYFGRLIALRRIFIRRYAARLHPCVCVFDAVTLRRADYPVATGFWE